LIFFVAAADVECIARTLDFDALQDNISNIAFCDIEQELVCVHNIVISGTAHYLQNLTCD